MIVNSENNNRTQHGIYDFFGIKETINLWSYLTSDCQVGSAYDNTLMKL
jgi:hypothetical protein